MTFPSRFCLGTAAGLLLSVLGACDQPPTSNAEGPVTAADTSAPGTLSRELEPQRDGFADRHPGDPGRSILVPSTTLFPGEARIDPDVRNPYSGDEQAIAAGERHFAAFNCAGCHAPLGGGGMGPPLSDDTWIYGSDPAQIYLSIMHGRPDGMPAWSSMLPERTVWELVAYIETLDGIENPAERLGFEENPGFEDDD